ncbi:hypothetical protein Tco_0292197, partial [Tanacetum coccineum]
GAYGCILAASCGTETLEPKDGIPWWTLFVFQRSEDVLMKALTSQLKAAQGKISSIGASMIKKRKDKEDKKKQKQSKTDKKQEKSSQE